MDLKQLVRDEDAVSPVIGVILMVAITVILAAVIGTFVLGLGQQVSDNAPQASFSFESGASTTGSGSVDPGNSDGNNVKVTHDGGDALVVDTISIGEDGSKADLTSSGDYSSGSSDLTAGDVIDVDAASGDTIRIIWNNPSSDSTTTIGKFEV